MTKNRKARTASFQAVLNFFRNGDPDLVRGVMALCPSIIVARPELGTAVEGAISTDRGHDRPTPITRRRRTRVNGDALQTMSETAGQVS